MKKRVFLLGVAASLLAACGNGSEMDREVDSGMAEGAKEQYVIGIDDTFAPMSFKDTDGNIVGFDVDLAKAAGEIMDVEFTFQPIDWVMKETELNSGNIDLIWNGYSITEERKQQVAFSDPYLDNQQIIVTLADSVIEKKTDLAGKTVATQQSSSTLDALNADTSGIVQEFEGGEPVLYPTFVDVFNDLDSGRSDAIVVDEVLGRYIMKEKGVQNYKVLEENFGEEEYGVGMRKDEKELQNALNQVLKELQENGEYETIYEKWFAE